jgi:hypothetical protein
MIPAQHRPSAAGFVRVGELLPEFPKRTAAAGNSLGGKGGSKRSARSPNPNAVQEIQRALAFQEQGTILRSTVPVGRIAAVDNPGAATERLARHLALALVESDGLRNIAFYRKVARTVPRRVVLDALDRAKDARHIRKSRAHLFAFLVRPHLTR